MITPQIFVSLLPEQFEERKFTRRKDLTTAIRSIISTSAFSAMLNGVWGTITQLAKDHGISRTFIYSLASKLKEAAHFLFRETPTIAPLSSQREQTIEAILSLRLEGGSSLNGISTLMERFNYPCSSVGFISQTLTRIGRLLPMTITGAGGTAQYLVFASDEIFSKTTPLLVTVDPCSQFGSRILIMPLPIAWAYGSFIWKNPLIKLLVWNMNAKDYWTQLKVKKFG